MWNVAENLIGNSIYGELQQENLICIDSEILKDYILHTEEKNVKYKNRGKD